MLNQVRFMNLPNFIQMVRQPVMNDHDIDNGRQLRKNGPHRSVSSDPPKKKHLPLLSPRDTRKIPEHRKKEDMNIGKEYAVYRGTTKSLTDGSKFQRGFFNSLCPPW